MYKKSLAVIACALLSTISFSQINPKQIQIVRDSWGVPHIFAKTDAEVTYGLAWAHAEDDFRTIQMNLLPGKMLLGSAIGSQGAIADYVVALLRAQELVDEKYETDISAEYKKVLEGYAAGISAYAAKHPDQVLVKGSFPITAKEMVVGAVLSLSFFSGIDQVLKNIFAGKVPPSQLSLEDRGSNTMAMNSKKTIDGSTYLAINPHQPLDGPFAWYEAHLCSEEGWNMLGALFPGGNTIFVGSNEDIGWSHTVNLPDRIDVFQLQMHPKNKLQYKFDGEWLSLEERIIKLKVKTALGIISLPRKAYWSKYGATLITKKGVFSIRLAANMGIGGMEQWYRMNKAHNFTAFKQALSKVELPFFNIMYADRFDTIYYLSNAKLPLRDPAYNWKATLPGNTSKTLWNKFHPLEDLPQYLNPESGYLYNMNHSPFVATAPNENLVVKKFDPTMGYETYETMRSQRYKEMIYKTGKLDFANFKAMKYDLQLPDSLVYFTDVSEAFKLNAAAYPDVADVITRFQQWDKRAEANNKGAAIYLVFRNYIMKQVLKEGNIYKKFSAEECVEGFKHVKQFLMKEYKTLDITLGDYQKLLRGNKDYPLPGLPETLAAMGSVPYTKNKVKGNVGESYIQLVRFTKNGPEIESIMAYGNSDDPKSKHYDDQTELYLNQKTKKMTLDKATIFREAERIYSPE